MIWIEQFLCGANFVMKIFTLSEIDTASDFSRILFKPFKIYTKVKAISHRRKFFITILNQQFNETCEKSRATAQSVSKRKVFFVRLF